MAANEKKLKVASFAAHSTRGLIRDPAIRRTIMMVAVFGALFLMVAGSTFLEDTLNPREHPTAFIIFWIACAWLTILAILLAVFDLLMMRRQARIERRKLRERVAATPNPNSPSSPRDG